MKMLKLKRVISLFLATSLVFFTGVGTSAYASKNRPTISESTQKQIKSTIENFFYTYEKAFDNNQQNIKDIYNYYDNSNDEKTVANILLANTLLSRRVLLSENHPSGLQELNKSLSFSYDNLQINNTNAEVKVTVTKLWNYKFSPKIQSGSKDNYTITFKKTNSGTWKIKEISGLVDPVLEKEFDEKGINPHSTNSLNNYRANLDKNIKCYYLALQSNLSKSKAKTQIKPALARSYNSQGASSYGWRYALNHNPKYATFDEDCTNFISQCLYEGGGLSQDYGSQYGTNCWFYTNSTNRSATWTSASIFQDYVHSSNSRISLTDTDWNDIYGGDIIQLLLSDGSAYHSLVVTGLVYSSQYRTDVLVSCHTTDRQNVSLSGTWPNSDRAYYHISGSSY